MKHALLLAAVAAAVILFVFARSHAPGVSGHGVREEPGDSSAPTAGLDAKGPELAARLTAGTEEQAAGLAAPGAAPQAAEHEAHGASPAPPIDAAGQGSPPTPKEGGPVSPPAPALKPGETFTPVTALDHPSKEELEAEARAMQERLEGITPLRTTWTDTPLHDVLVQLSEQTGLVLALGPRALARADTLRVTDPLRDLEPGTAPTVWNLLEALASQHRLVIRPWKQGALLDQIPDPAQMTVRIYALGDLVQAEWGNRKETEANDRLAAVMVELLQAATPPGEGATLRMHGENLVARQAHADHERMSTVLDAWRSDPKAFQKAYAELMDARHPTVSGAPPRDEEEEPKERAPK